MGRAHGMHPLHHMEAVTLPRYARASIAHMAWKKFMLAKEIIFL